MPYPAYSLALQIEVRSYYFLSPERMLISAYAEPQCPLRCNDAEGKRFSKRQAGVRHLGGSGSIPRQIRGVSLRLVFRAAAVRARDGASLAAHQCLQAAL